MLAAEAAKTLLAAFATQLEAQGVKVPKRRYVAPGQVPVWDDEQLVIALQDLPRGQPGRVEDTAGWPIPTVLNARFALQLVRSVPSLEGEAILESMVPTDGSLDTAGLEMISDAQELVTAALAIQDKFMNARVSVAGPGQFALGPCTPLGPDGSFAATQITVTIALD